MKTTFLLLLFATASFSQTITFPKDTPLHDVVARLFDGTYNPETGEVAWKPNTAEEFDFGASYADGLLYTVIDTAFTRNTLLGREIIIATGTYVKDWNGKPESCYVCGPSLSLITLEDAPESDNYLVLGIKKFVVNYGIEGVAGCLSIIEVDNHTPIIAVDRRGGLHGYAWWDKSLFYDGNFLGAINMHTDNEKVVRRDLYSNTTVMAVDAKKRTLTFRKTGTELDESSRVVKVDATTTYSFDIDTHTLIKLCN